MWTLVRADIHSEASARVPAWKMPTPPPTGLKNQLRETVGIGKGFLSMPGSAKSAAIFGLVSSWRGKAYVVLECMWNLESFRLKTWRLDMNSRLESKKKWSRNIDFLRKYNVTPKLYILIFNSAFDLLLHLRWNVPTWHFSKIKIFGKKHLGGNRETKTICWPSHYRRWGETQAWRRWLWRLWPRHGSKAEAHKIHVRVPRWHDEDWSVDRTWSCWMCECHLCTGGLIWRTARAWYHAKRTQDKMSFCFGGTIRRDIWWLHPWGLSAR